LREITTFKLSRVELNPTTVEMSLASPAVFLFLWGMLACWLAAMIWKRFSIAYALLLLGGARECSRKKKLKTTKTGTKKETTGSSITSARPP
jgi:hypothetical protein